MLLKVAVFFSFLILNACSSVKESPALYITNATSGIVKNIECNWAGQNILTLQSVTPGDSRAKSFILKKSSDFFGPVKISWLNGDGKQITKNLEFTKSRMPNISDKRNYNYVQIYLMLSDVEVISSDDNDADNIVRAMDSMARRNKEEAQKMGIHGACVPNRINLFNCPDSSSSNALIDSAPTPATYSAQ